MKRLLCLIVILASVILLTGCASTSDQLMFITDITYDEEVDVTTLETYYLEKDVYYTTQITGAEYEVTDDGYVCVLFYDSQWSTVDDIITVQELSGCIGD